MGTRIIAGVTMMVLALLGIFMLPNSGFAVAALALLLVGLYEWSRLAKQTLNSYLIAAILLVSLAGLVYFLAWPTIWIFALAMLYWLWQISSLNRPIKLSALSLLSAVLALWFAWVALSWLHLQSPLVLLLGLLMVWAADSLAYFGGKRFGKTKLAPAISPGKTWEGVVSGATGAVMLSLLYCVLLLPQINTALQYFLVALLAIAVSFVSVAGDLNESKLKRTAGMKDSGSLIPGHGGVLDRIDGLIAGLPLFALCWRFIA